MGTYLIDSNVIIDYTGSKFTGYPEEKLDNIFDISFNYSIISKMEVLGYNAPEDVLKKLQAFLEMGEAFPITDEIADQTILIKRLLPKIKLPDVIIAATALAHNLTLLTRNIDDFKSIPGLHYDNPWSWQDLDEQAF
jgi:predicted nucleic acid-binding protein